MSTATVSPSGSSRRSPRAAVAGAVIIGLCAVAGWWAFTQSTPRPESAADFRPDPGGGRGRWMGNAPANVVVRPREPVTVLPRVVTIRDGDMTISSSLRADASWNIYVTFNGQSLGGEARQLMLAVRRALDARRPPAGLNLTDAQRAALATIPSTPPELSEDQFQKLTDLMNQSQQQTANAPALTPIKQAMQAIAAEVKGVDRNAVKEAYAQRDAKYRSTLTPAQVERLLARGNQANPAPAAPPAAAPPAN